MVDETVRFNVAGTFLGVDVDVFRVGAQDQFGPVGVEGEGNDWAGDELVDLGSGHGDGEERDTGHGTGRQSTVCLFRRRWGGSSRLFMLGTKSRHGDRRGSGVKRSGGQPPVLSVKDLVA